MNIDPSNINNLPDTDTIHDHINNLINGSGVCVELLITFIKYVTQSH